MATAKVIATRLVPLSDWVLAEYDHPFDGTCILSLPRQDATSELSANVPWPEHPVLIDPTPIVEHAEYGDQLGIYGLFQREQREDGKAGLKWWLVGWWRSDAAYDGAFCPSDQCPTSAAEILGLADERMNDGDEDKDAVEAYLASVNVYVW